MGVEFTDMGVEFVLGTGMDYVVGIMGA